MTNEKDKWALNTGASRGIGNRMAKFIFPANSPQSPIRARIKNGHVVW